MMLTVKLLSLGIRRNGGQVAEVVVFIAVRDGFEIFGISAVGDSDTGELSLLCHVYCLMLLDDGIVGKLIPGDSATLFHKTNDPLCVAICVRDLIQCIFDEILIIHFALPLSGLVFV